MLDILKQYWNYDAFRPLQEEIVTAVVSGRDTFALLPTGGGKSLCYQVPALAMEGFCLVVSPLIALMQDQVMQLQQRGIASAYIHSGMKAGQVADVLHHAAAGRYKLLYVSPERLLTEAFLEYAPDLMLNLIAVDEAHCISQWGHDFRPSYRKLTELRLLFPRTPVLALTASANEKVQEDIRQQLALRDPAIFRQGVVRSNLFYHVRYTENKPADASALFKGRSGSGILYCRSRKRCAETAVQLNSEGIKAGVYHAGMPREERDKAQQLWTESHERIMCATTAFGMGIDKPDVRAVAHYDAPASLEEYYQEAGRAGRDGAKAFAVLFFNRQDIVRLQESVDIQYPPESFIRKVYHALGDYLGMPVGAGNEELQPFDALSFARNFKLDILPTLSAIRLLDREGFWQWSEDAGTQTTVQFTTDRETLSWLERNEPALSYVATGLLRLYGSIYHFPAVIRAFDVSRMLRIEKPQLDKALLRLSALGVIDYRPAVSGGTIFWLHNRLAPHTLQINMKHILFLRAIHEERVQRMIAYLEQDTVCRNIQLSGYFGETAAEDCGGCDVCRRKLKEQTPVAEGRAAVLKLIRERRQLTLQELAAAFPGILHDRLIAWLRELSDESFCRIYPSGVIFAN